YRPISNLTVISKLMVRLVCRRLFAYLQSAYPLRTYQSAYRPNHSTETAILRVLSDLLQSVDQGDVAVLVLLDLSAAFDTVDHAILVRRLELSFEITGPAFEWFRSYLTGRSQHIRRGTDKSPITSLTCGVPQGVSIGTCSVSHLRGRTAGDSHQTCTAPSYVRRRHPNLRPVSSDRYQRAAGSRRRLH